MHRMFRLAFATLALAALTVGARASEPWQKLLDPADLARLVETAEPVIVDIRSVKAYGAGHVEGAVSVPYHAWRGPKENPGQLIDNAKLTFTLQELGVEPDSAVVVTYQGNDATDFGAAARVYWTLLSAGVERVAILNGGINGWKAEGLPLSNAEGTNFPSETEFTLSPRWLADEGTVEGLIAGHGKAVLIDARPAAFFQGRKKHAAASWAGTLRDALNLDQVAWFTTPGGPGYRFDADPQTIRALAREAGWQPGQPIVSFCNTGHWAATNWFALSEIAGIENVKLYPESMVGWTRNREKVAVN